MFGRWWQLLQFVYIFASACHYGWFVDAGGICVAHINSNNLIKIALVCFFVHFDRCCCCFSCWRFLFISYSFFGVFVLDFQLKLHLFSAIINRAEFFFPPTVDIISHSCKPWVYNVQHFYQNEKNSVENKIDSSLVVRRIR